MAKSQILSVPTFDYTKEIDHADLRGQLIARAGSIEREKRKVSASLLVIAEEVYEAHADLASSGRGGRFTSWIESLGIDRKKAYDLIRFVEVRKSVGTFQQLSADDVAWFDQTALFLLTKEGVPEKAIDVAVKAAKSGDPVTRKAVQILIDQHTSTMTPDPSSPDHIPKHSDSRFDEHETCPNCDSRWWRDVDGGPVCDNCRHPHGEPVGDEDEDEHVEPELSDNEEAEISRKPEQAYKKAKSALGVLIRYFQEDVDPEDQFSVGLLGKVAKRLG